MRKNLIVYSDGKPLEIAIRQYSMADIPGLIAIQEASFPPPFPSDLWWNEEQLRHHLAIFPHGALCAECNGRLIGSVTGLIVNDGMLAGSHSWSSITDDGYIRNHDPQGDTLYIVDISVLPDMRKAGIGKWLMQSMYETVVHYRLKRLLGGGRMPGYRRYAETVSPEAYVEGVVSGTYRDPVLSFLLRCGRMPVGVMSDYLEDEDSCNYAALMEWRNPFFNES